ncbi:hypothetical protein [Streptomyces sp. NPDC059850]|uniref:hypothetical protein n=1 Tax=Streptomyces sp. NPDC059850 TaxID=3346970 RepID=UPI003661870E
MSGGEGGAKGGNADLALGEDSQALIVKGLRGAIDELRSIGSASGAEMGAGFDELSMTSMEAGHNGLAKDFEDFCELWDWGVRGLIEDASKLAEKVGLAAGSQWEQEQYAQGTFKVTANAIAGNPHLSEKEVVKKDWDELYSSDTYDPDYSKESFEKSWSGAQQTWETTREETSQAAPGLQRTSEQFAQQATEKGDR